MPAAWTIGVLLGLLGATGMLSIGAPDAAQDHTPRNWLAFIAESGGFAPAAFQVQQATPTFIVFEDGRAVWRDPARAAGRSPEMWREGRVDPERLTAFRAGVQKSGFFTAPVVPARGGGGIADATSTTVGVATGGASRIVSVYALDIRAGQAAAEPALRSLVGTRDAILALKPKDSRAWQPGTIRVGVRPDVGEGEAVDWPVAAKPSVERGRFSYFSGAEAKQIIAALTRNARVRLGGQVYRADWAPGIATPQVERKPTR
jgi:hypothetical protein